ncbi:MAG: hypothetical protein M1817_002721 [Caeruleum heppii]|nr:MAG: hypothetical protein M1817_002721 [Caeruleum heppii]
MRPLVSGEVFADRPHKASSPHNQSSSTTPLALSRHDAQPTYFLADERAMEAVLEGPQPGRDAENLKESSYGVRSLDDQTVREAPEPVGQDTEQGARVQSESAQLKVGEDVQSVFETKPFEGSPPTLSHSLSPNGHRSLPPSPEPHPRVSEPSMSGTGTPQHLAPSAVGSSLPSSPKSLSSTSFRQSDIDSAAEESNSQAIASSGDEGEADSFVEASGHGPQLVMPSINMPSRRPFTTKGKNMGKLKVLLAGPRDSGKTSLIKSIMQVCDDIVHVDPLILSPPPPTPSSRRVRKATGKNHHGYTAAINEVYASTKPYPVWWSDLDDSKVLRRRKSHGDTVLERNLCFVDTPGLHDDDDPSHASSADNIVTYVEEQLQRTASFIGMSNGEMISLLSGDGGPQVDVILYVVRHDLTSQDLTTLKRLSSLTNVIPIIGKADALSGENLAALKAAMLREMSAADIRPFLFGKSVEDALVGNIGPPYAVSAAPGSDADNMDASLLMSPDYVQPLVPSELAGLVQRMLEPDAMAWLRHSAAKKLVCWITGYSSLPIMSNPRSPHSVTTSPLTRTLQIPHSPIQAAMSPVEAPTSYALARIADHTQREDRNAQIRLAKWASQLQRSLQNERERYAVLARRERLIWLQERLDECNLDEQMADSPAEKRLAFVNGLASRHSRSTSPHWSTQGQGIDPHDPLGLLEWNEELKRKGWLAMQVVGSFGLIGGLALWIARYWNAGDELFPSWAWSWCGMAD